MINKLNDIKKFWLITFLYLLVFWVLPIVFFNPFFGFLNSVFSKLNIDIESAILYYILFIPTVIFLSYYFIHSLKVRFINIFFTLIYVIIPYLIVFFMFFYGLSQMFQTMRLSF
jgi:hypothetical protein